MKKLAILLLVITGLSCKQESVNNQQPVNPGKKMIALTGNSKPNLKFQYDKDLLVKEDSYTFCETNPTDEYAYEYRNGQISKLITTFRSMYSSTAALCNPASGMKSEEAFEYNSKGQLAKVIRVNSVTEYTYNAKGQVEKQEIISNSKTARSTFEYDSRGNLIREVDSNGDVANYTYDNYINPYYVINQRPQWISAFNKSPNNVIKATGRVNFERKFKYDKEGYPVEVLEDNGITYKYEYKL